MKSINMHRCLFAAIVLSVVSLANAQTPSCSTQHYGDFDFWVGSWQVHSPDGVLQGTNEIHKEEGNCLVVERWRSRTGGTGQSYNYYNPANGKWHQLWVSQGAIIDYQGALIAPGKMRLTGAIVYQADGRTAEFQGTWTRREDGSVLQEFLEKNPTDGEWGVWFKGVYTRKALARED